VSVLANEDSVSQAEIVLTLKDIQLRSLSASPASRMRQGRAGPGSDSMIYDITPPVSPRLKVWPGDTPPAREILMDMRAGANLTLSTLRTTVHAGAHADAPSHYGRDAPTIDQRPISLYLGPCQVMHVATARRARVGPADLPAPVAAERVLLATGTYLDAERFTEDFAALAPSLIDALADRGVRLVGLDTPSVDLFDDKALVTHQRCLVRDVAILENLVLRDVPDGLYELIALPLRLVGFDASPVRAVLRTLPSNR
jgi:arylformamidase